MTTTRIINKQAILLPAFLWYSCAVVNSSAALDVFWATEVIFDSMLSVDQYIFQFMAGRKGARWLNCKWMREMYGF
jgi:hypothetical protein